MRDDDIEPGDRRKVIRGAFSGFVAQVVAEEGDRFACEVEIFGRKTRVTFSDDELGRREGERPIAIDPVRLAEIEDDIARNAQLTAPHAFDRTFWLKEQLDRNPTDDDLPRLAEEFAATVRRVEEQDLPVEEEALARFRAQLASVPAEDRGAWVEDFTLERPPGDRLRAFAARLLGREIEDDAERRKAVDAAMAPILDLRKRLEAVRHAGFANDLDGTTPIAMNPELEAAIEAAPDDDAHRLVYADWLQGRGDPRGELVMLQDGTRLGARRGDRLLDRQERYFTGGLLRHDGVVTLAWRRGGIATAKVNVRRPHADAGVLKHEVVQTLLALPSARFLEELVVAAPSINDDFGLAEMLGATAKPTLRRLEITTDEEEEMLSWTQTGSLEPVFGRYPTLRELSVYAGSFELGAIAHPRLESLRLRTCGLTKENLSELARANLPALRNLEVWFGRADRATTSADPASVVPLLASNVLARVVDLALANSSFGDELCDLLARAPLLGRLERLDLSRSTTTNAGAFALADAINAGLAPKLERLDVSECYLDEEGIAALVTTGLKVVSNDQREEEIYEGEIYRYCAVTE